MKATSKLIDQAIDRILEVAREHVPLTFATYCPGIAGALRFYIENGRKMLLGSRCAGEWRRLATVDRHQQKRFCGCFYFRGQIAFQGLVFIPKEGFFLHVSIGFSRFFA